MERQISVINGQKTIHNSQDGPEKRALELLFKANYQALCFVSVSIVKDEDAAKDVVQDFFVSYWQRRSNIHFTSGFRAYAMRAVKNLSHEYMRKATRLHNLKQVLKSPEEPVYQRPMEPIRPEMSVTEILIGLPEHRRRIFMSAVVDGESYKEIAERNGITVNTVKTQVKRAYAFLRTELPKNALGWVLGLGAFFGIL